MAEIPVFSAGECHICAGDGAQIFVKTALTNKVFFFCPSCEAAWESYTPEVDEFFNVPDKAPDGIALPTREEIGAAGFGHLIEEEVYYPDFARGLEYYIRK